MSGLLERETRKYDYALPKRFIAQRPAVPRDSARLLVYDRRTKKMQVDTFAHLADYLPKGAVLVCNDTKVLPARFRAKKPTGGNVTLLYLSHTGRQIRALSEQQLVRGMRLHVTSAMTLVVQRKEGSEYILRSSVPVERLIARLRTRGAAPLPPYLRHSPLTEQERRTWYQTVFAENEGSAAAPTASLHFTKRLLHQLERNGCDVVFVTLHVGLGTFAPLTSAALRTGRLHTEPWSIPAKTVRFLDDAKKAGRPIIAVGTTAVRTLESAAHAQGRIARRGKARLGGTTSLFIRPGYQFRFVDGMITNFHVPRSSLLMLVAAMTGRKELFRIYHAAKRRQFRFFSFGDGMLVV